MQGNTYEGTNGFIVNWITLFDGAQHRGSVASLHGHRDLLDHDIVASGELRMTSHTGFEEP